jgi:hypothetical protein
MNCRTFNADWLLIISCRAHFNLKFEVFKV